MPQGDFIKSDRKIPILRSIIANRNRFKVTAVYSDRKPWWAVLWDLNVRAKRSGISKYEYMEFGLFRKSSGDFHDYCSIDTWAFVIERTEDPDISFSLANKLLFSKTASEAGLSLPKLLGHCTPETFTVFMDGEERKYDRHDVGKALQELISQSNGQFFAKVIDGSCGDGAFKGHRNMSVEEFLACVDSNTMIFEKLVDQHSELKALNPDALNTLRMVTVGNGDGHAEVGTAYLRIGRKGSPVDNMATGGVAFAVDTETGVLADEGCIYAGFDGGASPFHPDTGKRIGGRQLPFFPDIRSLAIQAANVFPNRIVGWDIGITPDGPMLIEGNRLPDVRSDQMVCGPYRRHAVMGEFIARFESGRPR